VIRGTIKGIVSSIVLGVLAYGFFFVPLGERTLFDHTRRIAETPEAKDLGEEVGQAGSRLGDELRARLEGDGSVDRDAGGE
jgi:hypothetical protein